MTEFKFGAVKIDPATYGSQGCAVLCIRDSGKTYTATELAERLFEAGIPFIAFDPIGVWRFLRVPGHGRGYPNRRRRRQSGRSAANGGERSGIRPRGDARRRIPGY